MQYPGLLQTYSEKNTSSIRQAIAGSLTSAERITTYYDKMQSTKVHNFRVFADSLFLECIKNAVEDLFDRGFKRQIESFTVKITHSRSSKQR